MVVVGGVQSVPWCVAGCIISAHVGEEEMTFRFEGISGCAADDALEAVVVFMYSGVFKDRRSSDMYSTRCCEFIGWAMGGDGERAVGYLVGGGPGNAMLEAPRDTWLSSHTSSSASFADFTDASGIGCAVGGDIERAGYL